MSTVVVIVIAVVVVVLILFALMVVIPRGRARARQREIDQRRDRAVTQHRGEAEDRNKQADLAERHARIAQQEAQRERADAQLHEERASMHEDGLVDHELVGDSERDRFAGTSAVDNDGETAGEDRRADGDVADRPRAATDDRGTVADDTQDAPRR
jgi:FtsZ-interacting cell division protein ZipA